MAAVRVPSASARPLQSRISDALADTAARAARSRGFGIIRPRAEALADPEFAGRLRAMKLAALADNRRLVGLAVERLEANGIKVFVAADASQAVEYVAGVFAKPGLVVKSKSNMGKELHLAAELSRRGHTRMSSKRIWARELRHSVLEIRDLDAFYGPVQALRGVSLTVGGGEVVTLVGANGAGKSTLLKAVSGVIRARGGVSLSGESILGWSPDRVARRGIAHVPEGRRIFPGLTVIENLEVGAFAVGRRGAEVRADIDRILGIFPGLAERRGSYGWSLSGGEQQMLAIGRGLMARPHLLLLDEPSLGLAPMLVEEVFAVIRRIREEGTTVLLSEQNAAMALSVADRGYVMETGTIVKQGPAGDLLHDDSVIEAYLGGADAGDFDAPESPILG